MPTAITAGNAAATHMSFAASAATAAQPMETKASAKVATREEVWRRRKWLRLAWARKQSWISVAEAAATAIPMPATSAQYNDDSANTRMKGAKTIRMLPMTASTLARRIRPAVSGAV